MLSLWAHNAYLCRTNDLPSTTLALSRTLDNTGQIQDLDLSTTILQHTGNGREGSESVRSNFRLCLCDFG